MYDKKIFNGGFDMHKLIEKEEIIIENMIYEIRGLQVMLDSDLAKLYQCVNGTKDINKAVKRNLNRFPSDFYFQLTDEEKKELRFQSGTTNNMSRTNPFVFTEQGVAMLSSVLHTEIAEEVSIRIMRSFVKMRKYFVTTTAPNEILINHENRILRLEKTFDEFNKKKEINKIFFEGELYDAYSLLLDILIKTKNEESFHSSYQTLKSKSESVNHSVVSDSLQPNGLQCSVHGILQARILQWVVMPLSRGSS